MSVPYRKRRQSKHQILLDNARPYYEAMLEAQGGVCGICGREPNPNRRFDIDHDHTDMYIRGLLCWRCNRWLWAFVTLEILKRATAYIKRGPKWFDDIKEKQDSGR